MSDMNFKNFAHTPQWHRDVIEMDWTNYLHAKQAEITIFYSKNLTL